MLYKNLENFSELQCYNSCVHDIVEVESLVRNFIALKNLSLNQLHVRDASGEDNRITKCFLHSSNRNSPEGIGSEHSCCNDAAGM